LSAKSFFKLFASHSIIKIMKSYLMAKGNGSLDKVTKRKKRKIKTNGPKFSLKNVETEIIVIFLKNEIGLNHMYWQIMNVSIYITF